MTDRGSLESFKFQGRRQRQTLPRRLWSTGELGKDVVVMVVIVVVVVVAVAVVVVVDR